MTVVVNEVFFVFLCVFAVIGVLFSVVFVAGMIFFAIEMIKFRKEELESAEELYSLIDKHDFEQEQTNNEVKL